MMKEDKKYKSMDEKIYVELSETVKHQVSRLETIDKFTKNHIHNVPAYTKRLCEKLGLDNDYIRICINSAYLHDVGKIFISPKILQKNRELTSEEMEAMKKHTLYGYNLCIALPELRDYAKAARSHHENLNGTGYPDKLSGKQIPFNVDIVKMADIYDSLTSKRQYKEEIPLVKAIGIIHEDVLKGYLNIEVFKALLEIVIEDVSCEIEKNTDATKIYKLQKDLDEIYEIQEAI